MVGAGIKFRSSSVISGVNTNAFGAFVLSNVSQVTEGGPMLGVVET